MGGYQRAGAAAAASWQSAYPGPRDRVSGAQEVAVGEVREVREGCFQEFGLCPLAGSGRAEEKYDEGLWGSTGR